MRWMSLPVILVSLSTMGCDSWDDSSVYGNPVFSEDGEGIAAVYMTFEEQDAWTHTKTRNYSSQVLMKEDTGSAVPTALTALMTGSVRDLFFMRGEEYIILGRQTDEVELDDGGSERDIWYDRIDLDGDVTTIGGDTHLSMLSCDGGSSASATAAPLRVIPSPDGTMLAQFEAETDCETRAMTVTFLDAGDLSTLDGPHTVPDVDPTWVGDSPFWATVEMGWTDDDVFSIGYWGTGDSFDQLAATQYQVEGDIEEDVQVDLSCFYPVTTSSSTNADDEGVEIDESTGAISITEDASSAYGCDA